MKTQTQQWHERIRQMTLQVMEVYTSLRGGKRHDGNNVLSIIESASRDLEAHCRLNPDRTEDGVVFIAQRYFLDADSSIRRHIERRTRELNFPPTDGQMWGEWDGNGPDDNETNDRD